LSTFKDNLHSVNSVYQDGLSKAPWLCVIASYIFS
jgi:hypothetical protein